MKKSFLSILLFVSVAWGMFGQTPPPPVPEEKKKATDYQSMVTSTLGQDIETASYYELVSWCRLLGIDEAGDKPALVQKLRNYFKLQAPGDKKEILRRIEITSARSSEYFSLEDVKEDYVLIQGNAAIMLTDTKDNTTHTIQAERVLYNQSQNIISASGNVLYTRKIGDKAEAFTGETFVFDADNWEGVLYYAQGERMKKMEEKEVLFHYSGKSVTRLKDNSILLEDGVITSSVNPARPNYRITASRIWVYGPGEWAIENAVLYLGNIPSLYIPFYFYSSDELFFNPVIGIRLREGAFLNNTIYLIGKKSKEDDALSFLQLEEAGGQDYEMELDGLFLRPSRKQSSSTPATTSPTSSSQPGAAPTVKHLKLMADVYSRLGGFAGVSLDASPSFKLMGGLGFSRSIFYSSTSGYTSYYLDQDYWNNGYFFNIETPFRFGLEAEFNTSAGILTKFYGTIKLFSDTFFPTDFYDRVETLDFGKMLGFDLTSQTLQTSAQTTAAQQKSLTWKLELGLNFAPLINSPFFQTLKIEPFSLTFDWASKTAAAGPDPILDAADPARLFFYPYRLTFPNFTVGVVGTIYSYTASNAVAPGKPAATQPGAGGVPDVVSPVPEEGTSISTVSTPLPDYFDLRKPDAQPDIPIDRTIKFFSVNTSYSLTHLFNAEHLFSDASWNKVEDITYFTTSSIFNHTGTSALKYQFSFLNAAFDLTGDVTCFESFRTTFIPFEGFAQTTTDISSTKLNLTNNLTASFSPFKPYIDFKDTKLSYSLHWDFYEIDPSSGAYFERFLVFDRNTVSEQKMSAMFTYQPEDKPNSLTLTANIPPVLGLIQANLNFYLWIFQTTVTGGYHQQADESWIFDPLKITEKAVYEKFFSTTTSYSYNPQTNESIDWLINASLFSYPYLQKERYLLTQDLEYKFSYDSFSKSLTTLDLWNLKAALLFLYTQPLNALGMVPAGNPPSQFLLYSCNVSYFFDLPALYFWRNRGAFSASLNSAFNLNFLKVVDSNFTLGLKFTLKIHRFLDIEFSVDVYNNNIYRYIPPFVDQVNSALDGLGMGIPHIAPVNPLEDLLKSFNFFNIEDRKNSFFKLKKLGLSLVHHLDDWDFTVQFSGEFKHTYETSGLQKYEWVPTFTFSLKWLGIPQIKKDVTGDGTDTGLKVN